MERGGEKTESEGRRERVQVVTRSCTRQSPQTRIKKSVNNVVTPQITVFPILTMLMKPKDDHVRKARRLVGHDGPRSRTLCGS